MPEEILKIKIDQLERDVEELRYLIARKTGLGSADIKGRVVANSAGTTGIADDSITPAKLQSNSVTKVKVADDAIAQPELDYEQVSVTVSAGASTGTATVTASAVVIGWRATGNQDTFIDNISISGTTLTVTLAGNAVADNTFQITLLKP